MKPSDAEEYTQALGEVTSGAWRQVALAQRLGVPQALGMSTAEWVKEHLGGYVRLAVSQRREAVSELTAPVEEGGMGLSQRQAGEVLGVGIATVNRDLSVPNGTGDSDHADSEQPVSSPAVPNGTPDPNYVALKWLGNMRFHCQELAKGLEDERVLVAMRLGGKLPSLSAAKRALRTLERLHEEAS